MKVKDNIAFPLNAAYRQNGKEKRAAEVAQSWSWMLCLKGNKPCGPAVSIACCPCAGHDKKTGLLMDEPLANLDAKLCRNAQGDYNAQRELEVTTIYVTMIRRRQ